MNAPTPLAHLSPDIRQRPVPPELIEALQARFGARCSTAQAVREQHGRDESAFTAVPPPAAVVFAESTQDVADAVKLAATHRVPVIPFGVGSSLEGHLLAVQGGISIDVSRMNQVLSRQRRRPHRHGAARRHPHGGQRRREKRRPVFPHRPGRRRLHRRHDRHPRQRHQRRALRHHAGERAGAGSGDRQRRGHPHRHPRQKEQRRLRPHPPHGGQRRHAGRHHRGLAQALPACPKPSRPPPVRSPPSKRPCAA